MVVESKKNLSGRTECKFGSVDAAKGSNNVGETAKNIKRVAKHVADDIQ